MKQLSSLEIAFLVSEIGKIGNAKLQQVYQPARKELYLQFHVRSTGRAILKVRVPGSSYFVSHKEPSEKMTGFCSALRSKLSGAILRSVSQPGFERVLIFEFFAKNEHLSLIFELFSKGNIILAVNGKIAAVEEKQHWSSRELAVGKPYMLPPAAVNPRTLDDNQLLQLLKGTKKADLVRFFALELSLGGLYAEELCLTSGIDKKSKPASVASDDSKKLLQTLKQMLDLKPSPSVIYANGKPVDAVPVKLHYYQNNQSKPFSTFSEALESYDSLTPAVKSSHDREVERLQVIIDQQLAALSFAEEEIRINSRRGGIIYEHYPAIRQLLEELNSARKSGGWDAVRSLQRKYKKIRSVDEKSGSVTVDFQ